MKILLDSLLVLTKDWNILLFLSSAVLLGAGTLFLCLKMLPGSALTLSDYFSLSLGGSLLALFVSIVPFFLLNALFGLEINYLIFPALLWMGIFLFYRRRRDDQPVPGSRLALVLLLLFLIASIYLRLAFISGLILPPYFDSAAHYAVIKRLMTLTFATSGTYYHLGFHALIAALSLGLSAAPQDVMLVFGQILLAVLPLPLYFLVHNQTKSSAAGMFAILLAGWGWQMPAHALNWGKYPALTSLLTFEFVLCAALLWTQAPKPRRWILLLICALGILLSTLTHTRSLVLIVLFFGCYLLAGRWQRLSKTGRILLFVLTLGGLAALALTIYSIPILRLTFPPYSGDGFWMTLLVGLLLPFALKAFPRVTFAVILAIFVLLCTLFVPIVNVLPGYEYQTLLDRPFVEIALYFPLSLLGGLGFAGLIQTLQSIVPSPLGGGRRVRATWLVGLLTVFAFGAIFVNALTHYNVYPSTCCRIFWEDDAVAFDWMAKNLPPKARILIASSDLYVLDTEGTKSPVGADAGIWIAPLLSKRTSFLPKNTDFGKKRALTTLCQRKIGYIYIGGGYTGFDTARLKRMKSWYALLLSLPDASVYKVTGCSGG